MLNLGGGGGGSVMVINNLCNLTSPLYGQNKGKREGG